jgi:hypothetical protein
MMGFIPLFFQNMIVHSTIVAHDNLNWIIELACLSKHYGNVVGRLQFADRVINHETIIVKGFSGIFIRVD